MRLIQHHQQQHHIMKVGASSTSTLKLEIFNTKLESHQHQHEAINLQHKVGISTTLERRWKSSSQGWHLNNINTKLKIFSTRLASQ
jgi:hypothetical protein